jgi:hypothetical protein
MDAHFATSIYTYRNRVFIPYIKGKVYIQVPRTQKRISGRVRIGVSVLKNANRFKTIVE